MQNSTNNSSMPNVRKNQEFKYSLLENMRDYFDKKLYYEKSGDYYNVYSLIGQDDPDRKKFSKIFDEMKTSNNFNPAQLGLTLKQSRGIGSFLGMVICDALGACTEFLEYKKQGHGIIKNGFSDVYKAIKQRKLRTRHGEITTWTDDASMGIAMAFSLLLNQYQFDPIHIRYMFILWLCHGLGNGGRKHSIGLGGNIKISMDEFFQQQTQFASQGQKVKNFNNGNGSLMRLATIPVAFHDNKQQAMEYSALQSRTTHNGFEAEQCCRLLAAIIVEMINRDQNIEKSQQNQKMQIEQPYDQKAQNKHQKNKQQSWRDIFDKVCQGFEPKQSRLKYEQNKLEQKQNNLLKYKSVQFLAKSEQQTKELYQWTVNYYRFNKQEPFKNFNKSQADRDWNWKQKKFQYSQHRNKQMPGYIGSYCMDGFAMALHTVWYTNSFKKCAIMNADMGGDCDTVGSIAGQMAGAIYGVDKEMLRLYSEMKDFQSQRFEAFLLGYKLVNRKGQSIVEQFSTNQQQIGQNNGKKRQSSSEQRNQHHHQQTKDKNLLKRVKKY